MTTLDLANELAVDDSLTKIAIANAQKIFAFCEKLINSTTFLA
jgi:hypothetical protein